MRTIDRVFDRCINNAIKVYTKDILLIIFISACFFNIATMNAASIDDILINASRPDTPMGPLHTNLLTNLSSLEPNLTSFAAKPYSSAVPLSEVKILIATSGHGPLTGISPQAEKDYWIKILQNMGYNNINWFDGSPSLDLLNLYDLVIYDAGGYWYPLSDEVEPLWNYHFARKPLIVVAPDVNYDWTNIKNTLKPTFCEEVLHINGVLGILPSVAFEVIANTGHEIITSVPTNVKIPVSSDSSYPDCFDLGIGCSGVLTQGYISNTEFGVGSASNLPSNAPYDPQGKLFSLVAYPGSESEGRTVLFGFPPTAITSSEILDKLTEGSINFALANSKPNLNIDLYIEDALTSLPIVNKAPGDRIDVIVALSPKENYDLVNLAISVPSELGAPEKVFTRERFSSLNENSLPNSQSVDLENLVANRDIQVVWRFKIADNAGRGEKEVSVMAKAGTKNLPISKHIAFNVVNSKDDKIGAFIITNRQLLYSHNSEEEVKNLLTKLYKIAEGKETGTMPSVIYYVDHYKDELKNWDQNVDYSSESNANQDANKIAELTKEWSERLAVKDYVSLPVIGQVLISMKYPQLMIIGGDEVIPFYRTPSPSGTFDETRMSTPDPDPNRNVYQPDYTSSTPLFEALKHNYYVTDSFYADIEGNNWKDGKVELGIGRVTGYSAKEMNNFLQNGHDGPKDSKNMIVLADSRNSGKTIANNGRNSGLNILNDDETPNTIENENWKDTDAMAAMAKGFRLLWHASHGDYDQLYCDSDASTGVDVNEILDSNKVGDIGDTNPIIATAGCHSGLLGNTDKDNTANDNLVWAFIDRGVSAYLGSSAVVYCWQGGKIGTDFYSRIHRGESIGSSFRNTLSNFGLILLSNQDKRTVQQFILYGVPWLSVSAPNIAYPSNLTLDAVNTINVTSTVSNNTSIALSALPAYDSNFGVQITGCTFESKESFEVPVLQGDFDSQIYLSNTKEPVIPYIRKQMILPLDSTIAGVNVQLSNSQSLGAHNIPNALNEPMGDKLYTSETVVSGLYPAWTYYYDTNKVDGNTLVNVYIAPLKYNVGSKEVTLYGQAQITVSYQSAIAAVLQDIPTQSPEYLTGEAISTTHTVGNTGSTTLTGLQLKQYIKDSEGNILASYSSSAFDLAPGTTQTKTLALSQSLPQGSYVIETDLVTSSGDLLGITYKNVHVSTGAIKDFIVPAKIVQGDDAAFDMFYLNKKTSNVQATGLVYIYDPHGIKIAELPSLPIAVDSGSIGHISIIWNTKSKELGHYKLAGYVSAEGELYGPEYLEFDIQNLPQWHAFGGVIISNPSSVEDAQGKTHIFAIGSDHALWDNVDGTWNSMGGYLTSDPNAIKDSQSRLHIFARGNDGALWDNVLDTATGISNWICLGGSINSNPDAALGSNGHIKIAVRGGDNSLWINDLDPASLTGSWSGFRGNLISNPYVIFDAKGRMHVMVVGGDSGLWDNVDGSWYGLGGYITSDAKPILNPGNCNIVTSFARGGDGSLWKNSFDLSSGTNEWTYLGGYLLPKGNIYGGNPEPLPNIDGSIHTYVVGGDGALWENIWLDDGSQWNFLGGYLTSNPSSIIKSMNIPLVGVRGGDEALWVFA